MTDIASVFVSPVLAATNITSTLDTTAGNNPSTTRLFRDALPSTCGSVKGFPGTFNTGTFSNNIHSVINNGPARCVTLTLTATCTGNNPNAHPVAYGPSFVPGDISQNYRGDIGSSTGNSGSQSMSLDMGANETIQVVVQAVQNTTGGAGTCSYSLTSPELDEFVAVPTLTEWAMIGLSLALAAMGGLIVWSRRKGLAEA